MIHNIPQPEISKAFTVEDIHRLRAWNFEKLQDATEQERTQYYRASSDEFQLLVKSLRKGESA